MISLPVFPITLEGREWERATYPDPVYLEMGVEFIDDLEDYVATDAHGRRVRLIVHDLRLLLAHTLPSRADISLLSVVQKRELAGPCYIEAFPNEQLRIRALVPRLERPKRGGRPTRSLISRLEPPKKWNCLPESWTQLKPIGIDMDDVTTSELSKDEFNRLWVACRSSRH